MAEGKKQYEVLIGLNLAKSERRVEPGDTTSEIPAGEVEELLAAGVIREAGKQPATDEKEGD